MTQVRMVIIMEPKKTDDIRYVKYFNWDKESFLEIDKFFVRAKKVHRNQVPFDYINHQGNLVISIMVDTDQKDDEGRICTSNIIISIPMGERVPIELIRKYLKDFEKEFNVRLFFDPAVLIDVYNEITKRESSEEFDKFLKIAVIIVVMVMVIIIFYSIFSSK